VILGCDITMRRLFCLILMFLSKKLYLRYIGLTYGQHCRFVGLRISTFGSEPYLIRLGNHVTVGPSVRFVTHDGGVWVFRDEYPNIDVFSPITVGDNVFIGINSILLPGANVGNNCVIGAGSVVKGTLDQGYVYAGVPAKKICSLKQYKEKSFSKMLPTKGLDFVAKKKSLLNHFF